MILMQAAWSPADYIELVKTIGAALVPIALAYSIISATRSKNALEASLKNAESIKTVSTNVDRLEKNTNSISERLQAASLRLGRNEGHAEGVAQERASALAHAPGLPVGSSPLPVVDEQLTKEIGKVVDAIQDSANGVEKNK